jgi:hypothetical protein
MSTILRLLLILASIATFLYFLIKIRTSKVNIEDALFWFLFSLAIIMLGIFPDIVIFLTRLAGIQSPVNGLFLIILFIILVRLFTLTLKVSMLTLKLDKLTQTFALELRNTGDPVKKEECSCPRSQ